jgi:hypothetical protein
MDEAILEDAAWTEHGSLLGKQLSYAFSLDIHYRMLTGDLPDVRLRLSAIPASDRSTYHVRDDGLTRCADGLPREVPVARILSGEDWIELRDAGASPVGGSLLLQADPQSDAPLTIDYRGVATLPRGFARPLDEMRTSSVPGTAFICTRHRCSLPTYRWLVQQTLFGFGQVFMEQIAGDSQPGYRLTFSFDLYSGRCTP